MTRKDWINESLRAILGITQIIAYYIDTLAEGVLILSRSLQSA